jgi:hypothetical protein
LSQILLFLCVLVSVSCSNETTYNPPAGSKETAITHYSFGKMVIAGKTYTNELQIFPNGTIREWSPGDPHYILPTDIKDIVNSGIKTLIIGTEANGEAAIPLETKNIKVHILNTHKAVKLFNESIKEAVGAIFHLNC